MYTTELTRGEEQGHRGSGWANQDGWEWSTVGEVEEEWERNGRGWRERKGVDAGRGAGRRGRKREAHKFAPHAKITTRIHALIIFACYANLFERQQGARRRALHPGEIGVKRQLHPRGVDWALERGG